MVDDACNIVGMASETDSITDPSYVLKDSDEFSDSSDVSIDCLIGLMHEAKTGLNLPHCL
jgi:hypothetical protein